MTPYESNRPRRRLAAFFLLMSVVIVGLLGAGYYALRPRLESEAPQIVVTPETDVLGMKPLEIRISDQGTGLKSVTATLSMGGVEQTLAAEQFAQPASEKNITVVVSKLPGLKEGPAVLRVTARDASLWKWFVGNEAVLQKNFTIDLTPPTFELVADDRYVNFGGVGAIAYKTSADAVISGVKIGDYFFPGFPGQIKNHPDRHFALFAHPYNAPADAKAMLVATDKAGNSKEMRLVYELKNVKYKTSNIAISDKFLQGKVAPLLNDAALRQGTPKDVFVAVNKQLRKANDEKIASVTKKSTPALLWQGAFSQLSNSKVEANFADQRTYIYNGEPIDTAYHLGYDLSVTRNYPVEAANSGTVAFVGDLGIYGNTVILDHGLGLFTLYSHLSSIDAKVGDSIKQLQVLGKTGETGLAAGDHLHYGVYLNGVAVLPVEWWDPKWIRDNIQPKLEGRGSEEIAEAQQVKAPRKVAAKRH